MDWISLQATRTPDPDYPPRCHEIGWHLRVVDGTLYDAIANDFGTEKTAAGEYVPLAQRRPSVRSNLCRIVIDQSVSLLFSEGHFPTIAHDDEATRETLQDLARQMRLNERMILAATRGAAGSVALLLRIVGGLAQVVVMDTPHLTPQFDPADPDVLVRLTERYKVPAADLIARGYDVDPRDGLHWMQREWDSDTEWWFLPQTQGDAREGKPPLVDVARTVPHGLGFVPVVWVRNLPGGTEPDGAPTAPIAAICTMIEVDYLLSQGGRGLKYASDPTIVVTQGPSDGEPARVGGAASALMLPPGGDAKLLEITGGAVAAVLEHVRYLRALVLETAHGNRADADKLSAAQSGRAMELMNQALVWLADRLRISYGEGALLSLLRMLCRASEQYPLLVAGQPVMPMDAESLSLKWPPWYSPTPADRVAKAGELSTLRTAGLISRETAVGDVAPEFDVEDVPAELARITADERAEDKRMAEQAAQVQAKEVAAV